MIDTAIFDMDGLLIDSEPLWRAAERRVFATVGLELSDAQCMETMGLRTDEVVAYWFERHPWDGPSQAEVEELLIVTVGELIAERGQPLPGVDETLDLLAGAGYRLALASSSPPSLIDAVLAKLGLAERFELTCSALHEEHGKPHPAVYLTTCRRLGVEPGQCVAFEDSPAGVRSAHAAGMVVVAVPHADMRGHAAFDLAAQVLDTLHDFRPDSLRDRVTPMTPPWLG